MRVTTAEPGTLPVPVAVTMGMGDVRSTSVATWVRLRAKRTDVEQVSMMASMCGPEVLGLPMVRVGLPSSSWVILRRMEGAPLLLR